MPLIIDADSMFDSVINVHLDATPNETADRVQAWMRDIVYNMYGGDYNETLIALSPRKTFRNKLTETYKANRSQRTDFKSACMQEVYNREKEKCRIRQDIEADDWAIYYAHLGYEVAAIDKDILKVCPTKCYNYKNRKISQPVSQYQARLNTLAQALQGDSVDGIAGAKGIGAAKSKSIMEKDPSWGEFSGYFASQEEAILSVRLVSMRQFDGEKVVLWEPQDFYIQEKY